MKKLPSKGSSRRSWRRGSRWWRRRCWSVHSALARCVMQCYTDLQRQSLCKQSTPKFCLRHEITLKQATLTAVSVVLHGLASTFAKSVFDKKSSRSVDFLHRSSSRLLRCMPFDSGSINRHQVMWSRASCVVCRTRRSSATYECAWQKKRKRPVPVR